MTEYTNEQDNTTPRTRHTYTVTDFTRETRRCAELAVAYPSWS